MGKFFRAIEKTVLIKIAQPQGVEFAYKAAPHKYQDNESVTSQRIGECLPG